MTSVLIAFFFSFTVLATGLPPEAKTTEATLNEDYEKRVTPFFKAGHTGTFFGKDKALLSYRTFEVENEKAAIVYVPGWTETGQKYAELFYNLNKSGYSIYVLDNRGQGLSQRLAPNPQMVHVEHYADYVADLKQFVDQVVRKKPHRKTFMLTHSMGGLIGAIYAAYYGYDLDGLILSSPLLQVHTGNVPESVAYRLASTSAYWGWDKSYIVTHGDTSKLTSSDFNEQKATHSRARWGKKVALWYSVPESYMSGSSNRWLQRTIEATRWLGNRGAKRIEIPVMVFKAELDTRVWNPGVDKACGMMKRCESHLIQGGYHELFLEADTLRDSIIDKLLSFFERN